MSKVNDLTGRRFCRLTVMMRAGSNNHGRATWLCRCDCGNETTVTGNALLNNNTKSCGCLNVDMQPERHKKIIKHGKTKERLFHVWVNMRARCRSPRHQAYVNYGGRGITVCPEWDGSYEKFRTWALDNGYDETATRGAFTLDRIDNNGPYSPDNCRWIPMEKQQANTRRVLLLTYNGVTKPAYQWSLDAGFDRHTVLKRIKKGWSVEDAITKPARGRSR